MRQIFTGKTNPIDLELNKRPKTIKFNLLINWYYHEGRNTEFETCLSKNSKNQFIDNIFIFAKDKSKFEFLLKKYDKCALIDSSDRITYKDFFSYANYNLKNQLNIVANLDIWFDESLNFANRVDFDKNILALSTTDRISRGSQDSWIFKSPIPNFESIICDFSLGNSGCDNRISYELQKSGRNVYNRCFLVKTHHEHASRQMCNRVKGVSDPYLMLPPIKEK